jgi:hypothetical protein
MPAGAKAHKDLYQVHQMFTFFREVRPFELREGWRDFVERGRAKQKRAEAGLVAMTRTFGPVELI